MQNDNVIDTLAEPAPETCRQCHLLISGVKYQSHWAMVGTDRIWERSHEKLLGVTIDKNLSFNLHISNICNKATLNYSNKVYNSTILQDYSNKYTF